MDGRTLAVTDDWRHVSHDDDSSPWMGTATLLVSTLAGSADSKDVPVRVADNMLGGDMTSTRPWDGDQPPRSVFADSMFDVMTESGARKIQLAGFILSTRMASVVLNLAQWK